jgi:hypothetical protein
MKLNWLWYRPLEIRQLGIQWKFTRSSRYFNLGVGLGELVIRWDGYDGFLVRTEPEPIPSCFHLEEYTCPTQNRKP